MEMSRTARNMGTTAGKVTLTRHKVSRPFWKVDVTAGTVTMTDREMHLTKHGMSHPHRELDMTRNKVIMSTREVSRAKHGMSRSSSKGGLCSAYFIFSKQWVKYGSNCFLRDTTPASS